MAWQGDFGDRKGKWPIILEVVVDQSLHMIKDNTMILPKAPKLRSPHNLPPASVELSAVR